ncbi:hypothetical protein ACFFKE_16465 [Streptomyces mutabilis]|uniref:hypothetical protein n=1 Tax=Streptomyces mutabilis TaxID=67332 RepID=UPI001787526F|nr:hypothetical protein [Streptomyces mutabilis]GGQ48266.1 hypothetical protein GCM10010279_67340 [Streptomyces mutabilis]
MAGSRTEALRTVGRNVPAMGTWATDKVFAKGFGSGLKGFRLGVFEASTPASPADAGCSPSCPAATRRLPPTGWRRSIRVVSASPPVIAVAAGDYVVTDLITFDERDERRATIRLDRDHRILDRDRTYSGVVESCGAIVVVGERLSTSRRRTTSSPSTWPPAGPRRSPTLPPAAGCTVCA